jgi:hypothetical protein
MIGIKIGETDYSIRSNWNEVTLDDYCEIVKAKDKALFERLSLYSGVPLEVIEQLKFKQLILLCDLLEFMDDFDSVNAFAIGYESELTIGDQEYWKIEKAKQLLKGNATPITVAAEIVELYTSDKDGNGGMKIGDKPVTEAIGMAGFFLSHCQTSLSGSNG